MNCIVVRCLCHVQRVSVDVFDFAEEGADYTLPGMMSFNAGAGDGSVLMFSISVNSDDFIEWDESIIVEIFDSMKNNVMISNSQYMTDIVDQDSKENFHQVVNVIIYSQCDIHFLSHDVHVIKP